MGRSVTGREQRQEAFATYVLPEVEVLLRVARSLTRNRADAEDLVQETLLRAYRAIDRFDGRHPRAWLLTILRNARMNDLRRRRPEVVSEHDEVSERAARPPWDGPEEMVIDGRFDEAVEAAFLALPERFRFVVRLVDLDGLSYQEAAAASGVPVGTVMSRLHRARRRMRDQLVAAGFSARGERP